MKRLLVILLAASLGVAIASGIVTVNDSTFDYGDTDIETAYVEFAYLEGQLQLILAEEALDSGLPAIAVTVPDPRMNAMSDEIMPTFEDLGNIRVWKAGRDFDGFSLIHEGTTLDELVESYLSVMGGLGFEVELEAEAMNSACYLFSQDGEVIRAVFDNEGADLVRAHLQFQ